MPEQPKGNLSVLINENQNNQVVKAQLPALKPMRIRHIHFLKKQLYMLLKSFYNERCCTTKKYIPNVLALKEFNLVHYSLTNCLLYRLATNTSSP